MAKIILRIQTPNGVKRISCNDSDKPNILFTEISSKIDTKYGDFTLYKDRSKSVEITQFDKRSLKNYGLKNGDMLLLESSINPIIADDVKLEDDVDIELDKEDGRIIRERNEQLCTHGPTGKCFHCLPLEPFDEEYLKTLNPPIKFLSFHSYLRKLRSGVDKGKFVMLENISCKIKPGCTEHAPWPAGICTKCQPNAVTLNRQCYRHVDYVQFENPIIVNRFLDFWRTSGNQRIGYLYGRYEQHKDVPLGIKAVVCAIFEPPQNSKKNSVSLENPDLNLTRLDELAGRLGLTRVGWIFTDLVAKDLTKGTVCHHRGTIDSYFLSAQECILAATFQNQMPNRCKYARNSGDGFFGSKYVTVVVTGDSENKIHFEGYQVSNQCMALVKENCFVPTLDAPELGYIKESSNDQYVIDVFYKYKDSFGNEVTSLARPLPVEYLLIDLPAAFPVDSLYSLHVDDDPFPIANREMLGHVQSLQSLTTYLNKSKYPPQELLEKFLDLQLIYFFATSDVLPLKEVVDELCIILRDKNLQGLNNWLSRDEWKTVETLLSLPPPSPITAPDNLTEPNEHNENNEKWPCPHCTFHNSIMNDTCEMCALPKN